MAAAIADRDPAFQRLRVKIHGTPDPSDAATVREYAGEARRILGSGSRPTRSPPRSIAFTHHRRSAELLEANAKAFAAAPWLQQACCATPATRSRKDGGAADHYLVTANLLARSPRCAALRSARPPRGSRARPFACGRGGDLPHRGALREGRAAGTRAADVLLLSSASRRRTAPGMINARERAELRARRSITSPPIRCPSPTTCASSATSASYRAGPRRSCAFTSTMRWKSSTRSSRWPSCSSRISCAAARCSCARRSSTWLSRDANRLAGVQHKLLGTDIGAGFHALNPGLARGMLRAAPDMKRIAEAFRPDGIYVLPESVADLPPLAGISDHRRRQPALARAAAGAQPRHSRTSRSTSRCCPQLRAERRQAHRAGGQPGRAGGDQRGRSPLGRRVRHAAEGRPNVVFEPDLGKLDLSKRDFVSLDGAAREGLGPDRRSEGGEARRAASRTSRTASRRGSASRSGFIARPCSIGLTATPARRFTSGWSRASASSSRMPAGSQEAAAFARQAARGDLLDHRRHRPGSEVPRGAPCGDGEGVRPGLPRRRLRALGYQRRGPARLHRRRPQPDGLQCRRLRQHREGDLRGLGLALCAARLGVATVAHERARARLSGGAAAEDGAVGHLRRDDHAGCRHGRSGTCFRSR